MQSDKRYIVLATFTPKSGRQARVRDVLRATLAPTRAEPGCLQFDLFASAADPKSFHLFEIFEDEQAFDEHRLTGHYKLYRENIGPLLESPPHAVRVLQET